MRTVAIVIAAVLILVAGLVYGRIHDHRPIPMRPLPASVYLLTAVDLEGPVGSPPMIACPWWDADRGVLRPMPYGGDT